MVNSKNRFGQFTKAIAIIVLILVSITTAAPAFAQEADSAPVGEPAAVDQNVTPEPGSTKPTPDQQPAVTPTVDGSEEPVDPAVPEEATPQPESQAQDADTQTSTKFQIPTQPKASVDLSSGSLSYSYPIVLPEGRAGMTPDLSLNYDSRNASKPDSLIALGWEISIPSIQREPIKGSDNLYSKAYFSSSISGNLIATTDTTSSQFAVYRPESDSGDYLKYSYNSDNTWSVTDKDGKTYTFGETSASRQDNPADASKVYKWMVSKISDTHGNEIRYTYTKANGQIYPNQIVYTYSPTAPSVHTVTFNYTSPTNYGSTVYNAGFAVTTLKMMSTIVVSSSIGGDTVTSTYTLGTVNSQFLTQKNLSSIQRTANIPNAAFADDFSDTTSFNYTTKTPGWEPGDYSLSGYGFPSDLNAGWIPASYISDFDNNGYPDLLTPQGTAVQKLLLNNGTNFTDATTSWSLPTHQVGYNDAIVDLDGDHFPDFSPRMYDGDNLPTPVYLNTHSGFAAQSGNQWKLSSIIPEITFCGPNVGDSTSNESNAFLFDINNDDKNDVIYFGGTSDFRVFLNTGNGWTQSTAYTFTPAAGQSFTITPNCTFPGGVHNKFQTMIDLNADGNLDYFSEAKGAYLNTGTGFAYSAGYSALMTFPDRSGFADVNGDNLVDLVSTVEILGNVMTKVFINTGTGFTDSTSSWNPASLQFDSSRGDERGTLIDVTGDGYPDAVSKVELYTGANRVRGINNGANGWTELDPTNPWTPLALLNESLFVDLNMDGINDFITSKTNFGGSTDNSMVHMGKPAVPNLLSTITSPFGGQTVVNYSTATAKFNDGHITPVNVVNKITHQNIGPSQPDMVTQYTYLGGEYIKDPLTSQQRFTGFHKVSATESGSDLTPVRITDSYYMQANGSDVSSNEPVDNDLSLIGKPYYTITKAPTGPLKKESWNKYGTFTFTDGSTGGRPPKRIGKFVYPTESVTKITDSSGSVGSAETYTFDTTIGEQTGLINLGFVNVASDGSYTDIGGDSRYQYTEYSTNTAGTIIKPKREDIRTSPAPSDTISRVDYYYDSQPLGVIGSQGDKTKQSSWISGNGTAVADTLSSYDVFGNTITVTNPRAAVTTYTYDSSQSYVATETNQLNQTTSYSYIAWLPKTVTDPNGRLSSYTYSMLGYLYTTTTQQTGGLQFERQFIVNLGNIYAIEHFKAVDGTNTLNTTELLDNLGRTVRSLAKRVTDGKYYLQSSTTYDSLGRVATDGAPLPAGSFDELSMATVSVPANLITATTYDILDRPVTVNNAIGNNSFSYAGTETTTIDGNNHQKKTKTDAYSNLIEVKEYNGAAQYTTSYSYDNRNLLTGLTDALGNVRSFSYNNAGWMTNSEDLHAPSDTSFGSTSWSYDSNGNKLVETKPNGSTDTRSYDLLDRPLTIDGSGTADTDYSLVYDNCVNGKGHVCSISGILPNGVTMNKTFAYGISGVPTSMSLTTLGNTYTTTYLYTALDDIKQTTYPNGTVVRSVTADWALPSWVYITLPGDTEKLYATITYDHEQKPLTITLANGTVITHSYDANKLYREASMTAVKGGNTIQSYNYSYDSVNNITQITEPGLTVTYTYDDLNRLTRSAYLPSVGARTTYSYAYDAIGNITSMNGNSYVYGGVGKTNPHAVTDVGANSYTYDDNGNIATAPNQTFTYNWQNQPTRVVVGGTSNIDSYYDESGQRFIYQNGSSTEIEAGDGYLVRNGVPEISLNLGSTPIGTISNSAVYSTIADHLNTPVKQIDDSGATSESVTYDPFGKILTQTGSLNTKRGYTGHEEDVDTGLVYAGARYYNPSIGRFMSEDPLFVSAGFDLSDPQSMNSYAYARNNPIQYLDPDGESFKSWVKNTTGSISHSLDSVADYVDQKVDNSSVAHSLGLYDIVHFGTSTTKQVASAINPKAGPIQRTGAVAAVVGNFYPVGGEAESAASTASKLEWGGMWTQGKKLNPITNLKVHADDHIVLLGLDSVSEYYKSAKSFVAEAVDNGYQATISTKGNIIRIWDKTTQRFGSYEYNNGTLTPKTYFKSDSADYWASQQRNLGKQVKFNIKKLIK
jgi:RHS repeat-associated protein